MFISQIIDITVKIKNREKYPSVDQIHSIYLLVASIYIDAEVCKAVLILYYML